MTCVLIWIVHSSNEDFKLESNALSEGEAKAAQLSETLASSAILALLLPAYTLEAPPERALPARKYNLYRGALTASSPGQLVTR